MIPCCHFCCFYRLLSLHASTLVLLSFGIYIHFSAVNTDCSFVYFWDSPWNLIVFVADGTITVWYILYTNNRINGMWNTKIRWCCLFSYVYQQAFERGGLWLRLMSLQLQKLLLVRQWVLVLLLTHSYQQVMTTVVVCSELNYWPAGSIVGHPAGAQAYCCQWVLLHGRLTPMLHWLHVSAVDDIIYGPRCGTNTKNFGTDSCIFITITILVFDRVLKLRPWYWLVVLGSGPSLLR